jgi:ankyrin repeat protein
MVQYLIENTDIDVKVKDKEGNTPLHSITGLGSANIKVEVVRVLVRHGANVNARDQDGNTPLCTAITEHIEGVKEVVKLLIECGADVNA